MKSITDYNMIWCACGGNVLIDPSLSEMDRKQAAFNFTQKHEGCLERMIKAEGREITVDKNKLF